jgi:hypothetical protein
MKPTSRPQKPPSTTESDLESDGFIENLRVLYAEDLEPLEWLRAFDRLLHHFNGERIFEAKPTRDGSGTLVYLGRKAESVLEQILFEIRKVHERTR